MKKFFDTLAVFVGSVLRLKPMAWKQAKLEAEIMRKRVEEFTPSKIEVNGELVDVVPPQSPFQFLGEAVLNALGFVTVVWLITQAVACFLMLLPVIITLAVAIWIFSTFFAPQGKAAAPCPAA